MSFSILTVNIQYEHDTVAARQRARQIARVIGFDAQDQTRISTAVSEIARNAFNYGRGGKVEYLIEGRTAPQLLLIRVTDAGPGIQDLESILEGRYESTTGMGLGITGARRLMDQFDISSEQGRGTTVLLKKLLPRRAPLIREKELRSIAETLVRERTQDPFEEVRHQNQELLNALEEIGRRQEELARLNRELEDTNRGVVALYAELDEKADHLRRADQLKSKFLSNVSHEFRSPLNSVLALSGLLLNRVDGDLSGEQEQQVNFIRRAAQDLLEMVNDLLDMAKVESGKVEINPTEFEVTNLFAALRGMLRPLLVNRSLDLVFEDTSLIPAMYSDEAKISQILRNFISNALKFTEGGEIRVSAELEDEGNICFSVTDTGIGIAPADQESIFLEFVQIDSAIQRRVKGTGLGLPLSRKLATVLGGEVGVHSQPGEGSTFYLRTPLRYRDAAGAARKATTSPVWVPDVSGIPVLFLEGDSKTMMMYEEFLQGSGFRLVPAGSAREAEALIERVHPLALVVDTVLRPEQTWSFVAKIKSDPATRSIPVLVTGATDDQAKAFQLGADAWLMKPLARAELIREIRSRAGDPSRSNVLIVDDSEADRYLLKQHLRGLPVSVREASSGLEGVRRACDERPDCIFLDLSMPDISGFSALDLLRNEPRTKDIPVIMVSSRSISEEERARLADRSATFVGKEGLEPAAAAEALWRALGRRTVSVGAH